MTYGTLINTQTIGAGGASSIDFNSIPQTYTDLLIVISARTAAAQNADNCKVTINGVTTNQSLRRLYGQGTGQASDALSYITIGNINGNSATASTFGNAQVLIPNYASTTVNKAFSSDGVSENNAANSYQAINAGLWSSTAAITSLSLTTETGSNFQQYSTASLYGVK